MRLSEFLSYKDSKVISVSQILALCLHRLEIVYMQTTTKILTTTTMMMAPGSLNHSEIFASGVFCGTTSLIF